MALDWTVVVASFAGGMIGLVGDWTGRRSARQASDRERRFATQLAAGEQARRLAEQRQNDLDDREHRALELLLANLVDLSPRLTDQDESNEATAEKLRDFMLLVFYMGAQVRDPELRRRLDVAGLALDQHLAGGLHEFSRRETMHIMRHGLRDAIGASLRGDPLGMASGDWVRLERAALNARRRWRLSVRRPGYEADGGGPLEPADAEAAESE